MKMKTNKRQELEEIMSKMLIEMERVAYRLIQYLVKEPYKFNIDVSYSIKEEEGSEVGLLNEYDDGYSLYNNIK